MNKTRIESESLQFLFRLSALLTLYFNNIQVSFSWLCSCGSLESFTSASLCLKLEGIRWHFLADSCFFPSCDRRVLPRFDVQVHPRITRLQIWPTGKHMWVGFWDA